MSEHFVDYATRVEEVYEIVRHSNPPQEPKTFDDVLRSAFLNVADALAAACQRIAELEAAGDALEKGIRACKVRCRYIPMDELVALQRTWRRTRGG